jgi:tight adherence protein C
MQPVIMSIVSFALVLAGVSFFVFGLNSYSVNELSQRLNEYVSHEREARETRSSIISRRARLSGSFSARIIAPWFKRLSRLIGMLTPGQLSANVERELAIAGNPMGLGPREFYSIRFIFSLIGIWLAFQILRGDILQFGSSSSDAAFSMTNLNVGAQATGSSINLTTLLASILSLFVVSNLPKTWLRRKVRARKGAIRKGLPDALDMLSVCADAGLGFDQSLQRVSEYWKTPLGAEFSRVVAEISMGIPRQTALRNLSDRTDVPELSSFVAVILQSDQLGMSITDTLHAQAKQMRIERRFRAQEQARKMPLKMLFPLLLLIFPAMLAVILGPMIPVMGELFTMLRSTGR